MPVSCIGLGRHERAKRWVYYRIWYIRHSQAHDNVPEWLRGQFRTLLHFMCVGSSPAVVAIRFFLLLLLCLSLASLCLWLRPPSPPACFLPAPPSSAHMGAMALWLTLDGWLPPPPPLHSRLTLAGSWPVHAYPCPDATATEFVLPPHIPPELRLYIEAVRSLFVPPFW